MCGASGQQTAIANAQQQFMNTLTQNYNTQFAGQTQILNQLQSTFQPILAAGPNQQGFSPAEAAALNTQATEGVGQGYANLQKTLAQQQAARGGGNDFLPAGSDTQLQAALGTSAANQLSTLQNQNLLANYAQGRANFAQAASALGGISSQMNPLGYAGQATPAGEAAASQANTVAAANNAKWSAIGGALGGFITGPLFNALGSGTEQSGFQGGVTNPGGEYGSDVAPTSSSGVMGTAPGQDLSQLLPMAAMFGG